MKSLQQSTATAAFTAAISPTICAVMLELIQGEAISTAANRSDATFTKH